MKMKTGCRARNAGRLVSSVAFAVLLGGPQLASANAIEISGWWGGNTWNAQLNFNGTNYHDGSQTTVTGTGGAGGFKTYDKTVDPQKQSPFESWCVDIFHDFYFPASGNAILQTAADIFGLAKANDLGRLATNHFDLVASTASTALNAAAFQLAIWEIVNEGVGNAYSVTTGDFKVSGTGASLAQTWLNELNTQPSASTYKVDVWSQQQGAAGWGPQDVAVFARVSEPGTLALLLGGIGILFLGRRRKTG